MGFRFRKSIRIAPGVRINLSKRGVSTSLGPRGATVNISKRGVKSTMGIPGTGLSYQSKLLARPPDAPQKVGKCSNSSMIWAIAGLVALVLLLAWAS